jgi:hypothetical protein
MVMTRTSNAAKHVDSDARSTATAWFIASVQTDLSTDEETDA